MENKLASTCDDLQKKNEDLQRLVSDLNSQLRTLSKVLTNHDLGCSCDAARSRRISGDVLKTEGIEILKRDAFNDVITL